MENPAASSETCGKSVLFPPQRSPIAPQKKKGLKPQFRWIVHGEIESFHESDMLDDLGMIVHI